LAAAVGIGIPCAMRPDRDGICVHVQHGDNCSISLCHKAVDGSRFRVGASDAAPVARLFESAGPALARPSDVRDPAVGGMFVWEAQLRKHRFDADAALATFVAWLKRGGGFAASRYAKLGLPVPDDEASDGGGDGSDDVADAVDLGINTLTGTAKTTPTWQQALETARANQ
jgi:hypothetical protein